MCPLYVSGLIGPGDRKSVQPMAVRLSPGDYDQLHHFIADGVWDAAPLESELLIQADRLVGGKDAVLVIDDTALPEEGRSFGWCGCAICLVSRQNGQLPNIGIADACAGRSAGNGGIASLPSRELDERCGTFEACRCSGRASRSTDQATIAWSQPVFTSAVCWRMPVTASARRSARG